MTATKPATWGTWKDHGHAAELMFHGNSASVCWPEGLRVTMTDRGNRVEVRAAEGAIVPGIPALFLGKSRQFWAAPVG